MHVEPLFLQLEQGESQSHEQASVTSDSPQAAHCTETRRFSSVFTVPSNKQTSAAKGWCKHRPLAAKSLKNDTFYKACTVATSLTFAGIFSDLK